MTRATRLLGAAFAFALCTATSPAVAQSGAGQPAGVMPPPPAGDQSCDVHAGAVPLSGTVPPLAAGESPVSVLVLPENDLTLAYLRSVAIAFDPHRSDPRVIARDHDARAMSDAMLLAARQSELVGLMHTARPNGRAFTCVHLAAGKYLVLATISRSYATRGDVAKYVARSNRLEFFAAEATVAPRARAANLGRFYRLGETAGAS
jgi:hypothetical protein